MEAECLGPVFPGDYSLHPVAPEGLSSGQLTLDTLTVGLAVPWLSKPFLHWTEWEWL